MGSTMGDLAETWRGFRQDLETRSQRLVDELTAVWNELRSMSDAVAFALSSEGLGENPPGTVEALEQLFDESGRRWLLEPVERCLKTKPLQRVLSALQDHESSLEHLARRLPVVVSTSGRELVTLLEPARGGGWRRHWLRWRRSLRAVPLRGVVWGHFERRNLQRASLDGAFQLVLGQACLGLLEPWEMVWRERLGVWSGAPPESFSRERRRQSWERARARQAQRAAELLAGYRYWTESAAAAAAGAVLRGDAGPSERASRGAAARRQRHWGYWSRQQRAVQAVLNLDVQLLALSSEATSATRSSLESLALEHEELLRELDAVVAWLEEASGAEGERAVPPPQAHLLSAEERLTGWLRRMTAQARARLPATVEAVEPRRALPGWTQPWRELEPVKVFSRALESSTRPAAADGLRQAEEVHQALVRSIERAREVVAFGMEAAAAGDAAGGRVAQEAIQNARGLLLDQRTDVSDIRAPAEAGLVRGQAAALVECYLALDRSRVGLWAHLTRQRGTRAFQQAGQLAARAVHRGGRATSTAARRLSERILLQVGWLTPPRPRLEPVSLRSHLGGALPVEPQARELPMIYQRLFRLAPVEDPRFLVGREAELIGLAAAAAQWRAGRGGSVLVVGARGSGKTSLLNCAVTGVLAQAPILRGQFSGRMTTGDQLHRFLRALLEVAEHEEVSAALAAQPRVVILEELERTFLRVINGFGALRELLDLICATSASALWVLSINETAFRYLDAVVGLSRYFSHRITAMSVERQDLVNAILQRHNLSGLRLEFAPVPKAEPGLRVLRRSLGLEQDAEELFFDALFRQSEGIFRAAFELWKACIEGVEGGAVRMRQPLAPNYGPLRGELRQQDGFLLQAVLQHGGLTVENMARVMDLSQAHARRAVDRLLALGILEPEPDGQGWRVQPEAGLFVRDMLHRQNLW